MRYKKGIYTPTPEVKYGSAIVISKTEDNCEQQGRLCRPLGWKLKQQIKDVKEAS